MNCAIMGNLDGSLTRLAFQVESVRQILNLKEEDMVLSHENNDLYLMINGKVVRVENTPKTDNPGPFYILLNSGKAFSVTDYKLLFNVTLMDENIISGVDVSGGKHLCRLYGDLSSIADTTPDVIKPAAAPLALLVETEKIGIRANEEDGARKDKYSNEYYRELHDKLELGKINEDDAEALKDLVDKLKQGEFYESLTQEFSGKIKDIATELIEFRRDLQKKIEPSIVDIAAKDIPEASNQLEGINETLENSTMRIMDINDEMMDIANVQAQKLESFLSGKSRIKEASGDSREKTLELLEKIKNIFDKLPEEAQQVVGFVVPGLDEAIGTLMDNGDMDKVRLVLDDPILTIMDLTADLGDGNENAVELKNLTNELTGAISETTSAVGGSDEADAEPLSGEMAIELLKDQLEILKSMNQMALDLSEPLSFQDLVGQRIQRIIKLVRSMEVRIEDLVISFGIKLKKYKTDPSKTYENLKEDVEVFKSELMGPAREGEGLGQSEIDDLLASL